MQALIPDKKGSEIIKTKDSVLRVSNEEGEELRIVGAILL